MRRSTPSPRHATVLGVSRSRATGRLRRGESHRGGAGDDERDAGDRAGDTVRRDHERNGDNGYRW